MANAAYTNFKAGLQRADFDLLVASVKGMLVRGYAFNAAHVTVADVVSAGGTINGTSNALANPTVTGGVFDADDTTITTTASASNHVLILAQTSAVTGGADLPTSGQLVIAYYDTGTGLPIQPGTGSVAVAWSAGAAKILAVT
jgi:hypothetical protein